MNNKEGKTFADLFSSSTSEKEVEKQTFSNIFKSENQENHETEEIKKSNENNNTITFDNIADSISTLESTPPPVEPDIFQKVIDKAQKEENKLEVKSEESTPLKFTEEKEIINPIFEKKSSEITDNQKESTNKEENDLLKDIFTTNSSNLTISSEEKEISTTSEFDNPFFNDKSINSEASKPDNPFFKNDEEEDSKAQKNTNIFLNEDNNQSEEQKLEIQESTPKNESSLELNNNLFFDSSEETSPRIIDLKLTESSFETTDNLKLDDDNPFFKKEDSSIEEKKSELKEPKITESKKESDTPKSSSPFFEEETKETENNPFFQGQLNLVENKEHNKPVGNIDTTKSKHFDVKIVKKKEPLIKFILGVFSYAIFIFLLLIGITLLVYVLDAKIRAAKGDYSSPTFNAYVVLTGSMLPEIEVNDVVITKKVEAAKLNEGDVITFASADSRFQGTIITHRIIKKNPPDGTNGYTFQTRGDNNNVADSALVPEANIYGKVILKIPKLGYLQEFLASDGGWIIVILIPCLIVISYDIVKLMKGLKRKKYKNIKVQK